MFYLLQRQRIQIFTVVLLLAVSLIFNLNGEYWSNVVYPSYHLFAIVATVITLFLIASGRLSVNRFDLLVIGLMLFSFATRAVKLKSVDDLEIATTIALILYYLALKKIQWKKYILDYYKLTIIICLVLSVYALFEYSGFIWKEYSSWKMSGNFSNPGLLAGFLSMAIPLMALTFIRELRKKKRSVVLAFYAVAGVLILSCIFLAASRAALLGILLVGGVGAGCRLIKRNVLRVVFFAGLIGLTLLTLSVKGRGSIDGRVLIWKISSDIFKENAIAGVGYNLFSVHYLTYQSKYFSHKDYTENELEVAGNSQYAFNEILKLAIENGVCGIVLLLGCCVQGIMILSGKKNFLTQSSIYVLLQFAVFAQFSYPLTFLCFKLLMLNQVSIVSANSEYVSLELRQLIVLPIVFVITAVTLISGLSYYRGLNLWKSAHLNQFHNPVMAKDLYERANRKLSTNGRFLFRYGMFLQDHDPAISSQILQNSLKFFTSHNTFMALGDNAVRQGDILSAEEMYLKAHFMIPILLRPQEKLVELYELSGNKDKACFWARRILYGPSKGNAEQIAMIRERVKDGLQYICLE